MKRSVMIGAVLALASGALAAADSYDLIWKPKSGDVMSYKLALELVLVPTNATFTSDLNVRVTDVRANGDYTVETYIKNLKASYEGSERTFPDAPASTDSYNAKGEPISKLPTEGDDPVSAIVSQITDFYVPDKPAKLHDSWTKTVKGDAKLHIVGFKTTYTLVDFEPLGSGQVARVQFDYKRTQGDKPAQARGTFLLDSTNYALAGFNADVKNLVLSEGTPPAQATIKLTR